jgi:protein arginine N-methyltransferase 1
MYSLSAYGVMLANEVRMRAFERALRQTVKPGMVVLEIGTGPGIIAVLACQLGARRVYTIEPSPVIQVARQIAAANNCADKIEFIEDVSRRVTSPIQADVIVSDLRGALPLLQDHIPSIADARRRFLAPGGILVGREDRLWVAVVEAPNFYGNLVGPWEHNLLGQDLSIARRMIVNEFHRMQPTQDQLLSSPSLWVTLDYTRIENPDVQRELTWTVNREGTGHGIVSWFDADLADGVSFSSGPGSPETVYLPMFLPWEEPVHLVAGQSVHVNLQAKLLEKDYFWRWVTRIESATQPGEIITKFDQSGLKGEVLSPFDLRRSSSNYIPRLSEEGHMRRRALDLIDGRASLEDIARQLTVEFPGRFARWQQAMCFMGTVSKENSL